MKHEQDKRKELLKKWKALPEPKEPWESFKRKNQSKKMESFKEYQIERRPGPEVQSRHEWAVDGDELKLDIHGNIETIDGLQFKLYRTGERTTSKIRIRARMEQLLRRLGINAKFRPSDKRTSDISLIWDDGGEKSGKLIIYRPEQQNQETA